MSRSSRTDALVLAGALAGITPFVLELAGISAGEAGAEVRRYVGNIAKLGFLLIATAGAIGSAKRFELDNPMRATWRLFAAGFVAFSAGQAVLGTYQAILRLPSPFPSLADVFFMCSYPLFLIALWQAIRAYGTTGYPIGSARERSATAGAVVAAAVLVGYPTLKPVLATPAPPLVEFLNIAYPVLDLAVLVPVAILLRIALKFRGGEVWKVWAALLAGFTLMCVGDILFAYFSAMAWEAVDPLIHVMYVLAYAALARGALGQHQLLEH